MAEKQRQLTLNFEGGLTRRYASLLEVVSVGAYRNGYKQLALAMDQAPGNLTLMLSGARHFPLADLETYIDEFSDLTPIYYLVEKYLRKPETGRAEQLEKIRTQMAELQRTIEGIAQGE